MITDAQSRALVAYLADRHHCTVLSPESTVEQITEALVATAADASALVKVLTEALSHSLAGASHTFPIPGTSPCRSVVLLSREATSTPARRAEVAAHEVEHGAQGESAGSGQVIVDYVMSSELRGLREAQGYAVGLFIRHLLTGADFDVDAGVAALSSDLYALTSDDITLARAALVMQNELVAQGKAPSLRVAIEALVWLRANAPEAIVAPKFARVPS